jgi:ubiquinone/menaquinone biosynthesis C-methylase UbiE
VEHVGETIALKGAGDMHASARHRQVGAASDTNTRGLILKGGWRYDLHSWFIDTCLFRGQWGGLRKQTICLADLHPGDTVLDVGCGTGTLALEAARHVGSTGRVYGIDPGAEQITHARAKAARREVPVQFEIGVIEHLPFPDATIDVVFSTLMMHHLPAPLKRRGLAEIARVLTHGGRLVIADFTRKQDRTGQVARFHAGGTSIHDLADLVRDSGFEHLNIEDVPALRISAFPGAGILRAYKTK